MKKFVVAVFALALFSACDTDKVIDNFSLGIKPELMQYSAMLDIYDASDSVTIPSNLLITVESDNADDVYEGSGKSDLTPVEGRIEIGLHPRANPTPNSPVNVRLHITADGYLDTYYDVNIDVNSNRQVLEIPMINRANPPSGVGFKTETTSLQGDSLPNSFQTALTPSAGSSVGMEIDLPEGTSFIDRNGNPISGSDLDMDIGQFDPSSESALSAFPGGFAPDSVSLGDGSASSGNFLTAGFTAMNMSIGGTEVKSFTKPITVKMDLAAGARNPETGTVIALGDSVPVWSFDETEGVWAYETTGVAIQGSNGLQVEYQTTHLSWWNLDFYGTRCCGGQWVRNGFRWTYQNLGPCATLTVNMPGWDAGVKDWFNVKVVYAGTNQPVSRYASRSRFIGDGSTITYRNVPNFPVQVKVYDQTTNNLLGQTQNLSLCSGSPSITVNAPVPTVYTLDIEGFCKDDPSITLRPYFYLYYKPSTSRYYQYLGYVANGSFSTTKVEMNQEYDFRTYYNGQVYEKRETITRTDYSFRIEMGDFCNSL